MHDAKVIVKSAKIAKFQIVIGLFLDAIKNHLKYV